MLHHSRFVILLLVLLCIFLTGCDVVWQILPTPTPTPLPPTNTVTPLPTETRVWFPPTETPTPVAGSGDRTPTPDLRPINEEVLYRDDFGENSQWERFSNDAMVASYGVNELTLALKGVRQTLYSFNLDPMPNDYYLELLIEPSLCRGGDQYGFLFRTQSRQEFYRLMMSCDGQIQLDLVRGNAAIRLVETKQSAPVFSGPEVVVKLNLWLVGDGVRVYINDVLQAEYYKLQWYNGGIGVFTRSSGENALTVSFSDLILRDIQPLPPTPIPSVTSTTD